MPNDRALDSYSQPPRVNKYILILLSFLWVYDTIVRYGKIFLGSVPIIGTILYNYLPTGILITLSVLSLRDFIMVVKWKDLMFSTIVIIISLITLLINSPYNAEFCDSYINTFLLNCLPAYFIGLIAANKLNEESLYVLFKLSVISIFMATFVIIRNGLHLVAEWSSSMYLSYIMLPHAMMVLMFTFKKINPLRIITVIVSFVYMVMMGNRGSLICYFIFMFILILNKYISLKSKKLFFFTAGTLLIAILLIFTNLYNDLLNILYTFALKNGFSIRIFLTLQSGSGISIDSGRLPIYSNAITVAIERFFGYGFGSDVYFLEGYAHNIFLEWLIEFGFPITILLIAIIVAIIVKFTKQNKNNSNIILIMWLLFCASVVKLCISGTYLTDVFFYVFIGFIVGGSRKNIENITRI